MSEFTVCRTLDTHPALRYCLLLDDYRIAGGKPDYRGNNIIISWRTKATYGPVDALMAENAKLRELVQDYHRYEHEDCYSCRYINECRADESGRCIAPMRLGERYCELGIEVDG